MIEITTITTGETYKFDQETERIYKSGVLIPKTEAEPVYSGMKFAGIYLKTKDSVLSLSGKINKLTDPETL